MKPDKREAAVKVPRIADKAEILSKKVVPIAKCETIYKAWTDDTEDRLVLYADIMGFKNRVLTSDVSQLRKDLTEFTEAWKTKMKPLKINEQKLQYVQFSDSILIIVNGTDADMFNLITKAADCLMYNAMKYGFPIKGIIAQGKFSFNQETQLYFGRPLVDAAMLYDEIKYYGIVVHHSAEGTVKKFVSKENYYTNTPIPLEKGKTGHYHLCWNMVDDKYQPKDMTNEYSEFLDKIAESVSGRPRIYIDATKEVFKQDAEDYKNNVLKIPSKESISKSKKR